jgi:hypothetical protein
VFRLAALLIVMQLLQLNVKAQQVFQKTYNSDSAFVNYAKDEISAMLPVNGGYVLAGSTQGYSNISSAGLLMQVDANGVLQNQWSYRAGYITRFKSIVNAGDGNYIVCGTASDCNNDQCPTNMVMAKINPQGQPVWTKEVSGGNADYGYSIRNAANGNFVVSGWYDNINDDKGFDILVAKINTNGDTLWVRAYGSTEHEFTYDAVETPSKHVLVTANQNGTILLLKLRPDGSLLWTKTYGGGAARKVIPTADGYILAGHKSGSNVFQITDPFILKLDTNGIPQFYKTFYGADYDYLSDIKPTPDGGFIISGTTASFAYDVTDLYLIKCDSVGTLDWARAYGSYEYDEGISVLPTADGYLACGYTGSYNFSNGTRYHAWLLQTDSNGSTGNCQDHKCYPVVNDNTVTPANITLAPSGRVGLSPTTFLVENYTMHTKDVCPGWTAIDENEKPKVLVYPNPSNGLFTIESSKPIKQLKIYYSYGQLVYIASPSSTKTTVDLTHLPAGMYLCNIDGYSIKLIKE